MARVEDRFTRRRAGETAEEQAQRATDIGAKYFKWSKIFLAGSAALILGGILIDLVATGGAFTALHIATAGMRILGVMIGVIAFTRFLKARSYTEQAKKIRVEQREIEILHELDIRNHR